VSTAQNCSSSGLNAKPKALIIDGATLLLAMGNDKIGSIASSSGRRPSLEGSPRNLLLKLTTKCKAVVACRVSPDQKRGLVALVKYGVPNVRALAIGDGANDVAMIQEGHIGVGIKGEEGLQAVNSADYAIAQFRFLSILLLKHGRYNNINMSKLVCYMFYKNIMMSMGQFWFNFNNGFSGQKYYTEVAIQLFNLIYSAFPILLLGIYDKDLDPEYLYKYPQLYKAVVQYEFFNVSYFTVTVL
jgi:phospholipid-transporting ATPase